MEDNIVLIDDLSIRDKIYTIRGVRVMLDFDLAEIYGYETKNFNRQVKNNKEKFPEDMKFQLTREEADYVSRCRKSTSIMQVTGMKGGRVYLPYAFTEQGIYMLMTILRGELAVRQSRALVMAFKSMKDHIVAGRSIAGSHEMLQDASSNRKNSDFFPES